MKWLFLWLFPLAAGLQCGQQNEETAYWSKSFSGKAGSEEIVLFLAKGNLYSGYLWFGHYPYPLTVSVNYDSTESNRLNLIASDRLISMTISANLKDDVIAGTAVIDQYEQVKTVEIRLKADEGYVPFSYFYEHFEKASEGDSAEKSIRPANFEFSSGSIWTDKKSAGATGIRESIRSLAGVHTNTEPSVWMQEDLQHLLNNWQKNQSETAEGYAAPEQMMKEIEVFHEDDSVITLSSFIYEYSGGAHGMHYTNLINTNKHTGAAISLFDVLTEEELEVLPAALEKVARQRFDAENVKSLRENGFFTDTIGPTENYYILKNGIGFYYTLYDLRPYADGEIVLFVPFDELRRKK